MNTSTQQLTQLQRALGYKFEQLDLLTDALTHRSYSSNNNERLEFLGDGILNGVIAAALYKSDSHFSEGALSRLRASLVCESSLAEIAEELGLGGYLRLGPGEAGSHRRASVQSDAYEAVIAAIYLDSGYESAEAFILRCFEGRLSDLPDPEMLKDPKTRLQEYLQARSLPLPEYKLLNSSGPAHKRHFVVACEVPSKDWAASGEGASRRKAEQAAAEALLEQF